MLSLRTPSVGKVRLRGAVGPAEREVTNVMLYRPTSASEGFEPIACLCSVCCQTLSLNLLRVKYCKSQIIACNHNLFRGKVSWFFTNSSHPSYLYIQLNWSITRKYAPVQFTPSPLYPSLQVHVYDPGVLVHRAFSSQGSCIHSSRSAGIVYICKN